MGWGVECEYVPTGIAEGLILNLISFFLASIKKWCTPLVLVNTRARNECVCIYIVMCSWIYT